MGFLTRSDTNRAVHPQKMAGGLVFPCSENKGTDQLHGNPAKAKCWFSHNTAHLRFN